MQNIKIYIAGHKGMVGSAIARTLRSLGHTNLIGRSRAELDLTSQAAVNAFFAAEKPDQVYLAAAELGMEIRWEGEGVKERGYWLNIDSTAHIRPNTLIVAVDPRYFRPTEVETLRGDATKAREKLGWSPKISFAVVAEMVREDRMSAQRDELVTNHGYKTMAYHE